MHLAVAVRSLIAVLTLTALLAPATIVGTAAPAAAAGTRAERAERQFVRKINAARERRDLRPMRLRSQVRGVARDWSRHQARTNRLAHNPYFAVQISGDWRRIGENVGFTRSPGASVRQLVRGLHRSLMASPGHRANILGRYNRVGVGVKFDSTGRMWVTQNFVKF